MPLKFEKLGIAFQYPDNWELDEQDALAGGQSVTVYSPGGGFWTIALHPASTDPDELSRAAVDAMREEYKDAEVQEARETVAGHELAGYDLSFYCLELTNTARIRSLRFDQTTYLIFCQAEDREFDRVEAVFRAMTASLLGGLKHLG